MLFSQLYTTDKFLTCNLARAFQKIHLELESRYGTRRVGAPVHRLVSNRVPSLCRGAFPHLKIDASGSPRAALVLRCAILLNQATAQELV